MALIDRKINTSFLRAKSASSSNAYISPSFASMTHDQLASTIYAIDTTINKTDLTEIFAQIKYEGFNLDEVMKLWLSAIEDVSSPDRSLFINTVLAMAANSIFKIKTTMKYANNGMISQIIDTLKKRNLTVSRIASVMPIHMYKLVMTAEANGVAPEFPFKDMPAEAQLPGIGSICTNGAWALSILEARIRGIGRIQKPQYSDISKDLLLKQIGYFLYEINSTIIGDLKARTAAIKGLTTLEAKTVDMAYPMAMPTAGTDPLWVNSAGYAKKYFGKDLVW